MASWHDKDDLDLTADDLGEMLAAGTPVEVITPHRATFALEWVAGASTFAPTASQTFAAAGSGFSKNVRLDGAKAQRTPDDDGRFVASV